MTDKEVGDLWKEALHTNTVNRDAIMSLIRKLVEERASKYGSCDHGADLKTCLDTALRDLGIDPATWE